MAEFFKSVCIVVLVTILLFVAINVGSYVYLEMNPIGEKVKTYFVGRNSDEGLRFRKEIFDTDDETLLDGYADAPGIRPPLFYILLKAGAALTIRLV